jgi:hypothetical protein
VSKIPKWAYVAAGLVAVAAFLYFRHSSSASAATTMSAGNDPTQASPDQPLPSQGDSSGDQGSQQGDDSSGLLAELLAMQGQNLNSFLNSLPSFYGTAYGANPAGQSDESAFGLGGTQPPGSFDPTYASPYASPYVYTTAGSPLIPPGTPGGFYTTPSGGIVLEHPPIAGVGNTQSAPVTAPKAGTTNVAA